MKLGWLALTALLATACGGGGDAPAAKDDGALRDAVQSYSDAYLTGDDSTAFDALSSRCQDKIGADAFSAVVSAAGETYGSPMPIKSFSADMNGEQARATYTYDAAAINQKDQPWVNEGGWKYDAC